MPPSSRDAPPRQPFGGYHALVLAAGAGSRFGGDKMLADWRGRPMIAAAVDIALAAPVVSITVVLGCRAPAVAAALPTDDARLRSLTCADWAAGLSASLRTGLEALPADAAGCVIFLGDMPAVPPTLAGELLWLLGSGAPAVETRFRGLPAHPVAFAPPLFERATLLVGDQGARAFLAGVPDVAIVATDDPGSVLDIDRPHDLPVADVQMRVEARDRRPRE